MQRLALNHQIAVLNKEINMREQMEKGQNIPAIPDYKSPVPKAINAAGYALLGGGLFIYFLPVTNLLLAVASLTGCGMMAKIRYEEAKQLPNDSLFSDSNLKHVSSIGYGLLGVSMFLSFAPKLITFCTLMFAAAALEEYTQMKQVREANSIEEEAHANSTNQERTLDIARRELADKERQSKQMPEEVVENSFANNLSLKGQSMFQQIGKIPSAVLGVVTHTAQEAAAHAVVAVRNRLPVL